MVRSLLYTLVPYNTAPSIKRSLWCLSLGCPCLENKKCLCTNIHGGSHCDQPWSKFNHKKWKYSILRPWLIYNHGYKWLYQLYSFWTFSPGRKIISSTTIWALTGFCLILWTCQKEILLYFCQASVCMHGVPASDLPKCHCSFLTSTTLSSSGT